MATRRFEVYQYRQVLTRIGLDESDREMACREWWLEATGVMPDDATLAQVLDVPSSQPRSASAVVPYLDKVTLWGRQGIRDTLILQASSLC